MLKLLVYISLFLFVLNSYSQKTEIYPTNITKSGGSGTGQVNAFNSLFSNYYDNEYKLFKEKDEKIKGSRFVYDDFAHKGLVFVNDVVYTTYGINIDAVDNDIVTMAGKDSIFILEKIRIDSIRIDNKDFKKFNGDTFYEILNNGKKAALLKNYKGRIVEGYDNLMKGTKGQDKYFISSEYLIKRGNDFEKLETSKKGIIGQLSDAQGKIKPFIKKNRLSVKKEEDLIKLFEYYNSL